MYRICFNDIKSKGYQSEIGYVHQTSCGDGVTTVRNKGEPLKEQLCS